MAPGAIGESGELAIGCHELATALARKRGWRVVAIDFNLQAGNARVGARDAGAVVNRSA